MLLVWELLVWIGLVIFSSIISLTDSGLSDTEVRGDVFHWYALLASLIGVFAASVFVIETFSSDCGFRQFYKI